MRYRSAEVAAASWPPPVSSTLRETMSQFATGVTVLTTGGDRPHGMTANAFSSVSLDPPSVLCCVAHSAVMHQAVLFTRHFGVSIMSAGQEGLAHYFADKKRPLGPAQFHDVEWRPGPSTGVPLLAGALAWLECTLVEWHDVGDHSIFIGEVLASTRGPGGDSLLFFDGTFARAVRPSR